MPTDRELLRRHVENGSEPAFAELVRRHAALVYGTALRGLCGNATLAADVTQAVFTALAARAPSLLGVERLAGWLHTTTRHTVSHAVRAERRRQERERKAALMETIEGEMRAGAESPLPPGLLDEALASLAGVEREVVLRRFFEGQSFAEIGAALRLDQDAARMRVNRALEKLRRRFARRGVTTAVAAILAAEAVAAPSSLVAGWGTAALAGAGVVGAAGSAIGFMAITKMAAWMSGAVAALAIGWAVHEHRVASAAEAQIAQLQTGLDRLRGELAAAERQRVEFGREAGDARRELEGLQRNVAALQARLAAREPASPPPSSRPAPPDGAADTARMARLRPALAAGRPITGAFITVGADGKPASQPVSFVMGRETRIDCGALVCDVQSQLNDDGSVRYALTLRQKNAKGEPGTVIGGPTLVSAPWAEFAISVNSGPQSLAFAFDPDPIGDVP